MDKLGEIARGENMICYSQTKSFLGSQETYETASKDAGRRARQLRKAGYKVITSALGPQVTLMGTVKMTLVDIRPGSNEDACELPPVQLYVWQQ